MKIPALCAVLLLAGTALADDGDPPERVAVTDLVEGAAAAQFAGSSEWTADLANRPLSSGDKIWVDANSRAELHLGNAALRLGADTGLQFLNVGDRMVQLRLSAGSLNVRLRYLSPDETVEVDTPNSAISLVQAGEYRIDVSNTGDAVSVAVWRGQVEVAGQTQSFNLQEPQQGEFSGTDTLGVQFGDLPSPDSLDQWSQALDAREDESLSANFLSRDMSGYSDLDGYGDWQADADYGQVWYPPVATGWAPYSQGCWIWVAPWGWTWVDNAPWGFVPFHYGRWVHLRSGWAWAPGQLSVRPVYAPALVGWGSGPNSSIVWVPLGYNEIYRPSKRVSNHYLQRVNVTNTYINATATLNSRTAQGAAHFANQAVPGALLAVTPDTFTSARGVSRDSKSLRPDQATMTGSNTLPPSPRSLARAAGSVRGPVPVPPHTMFSRPMVVRSAPPNHDGNLAPEQSRVILTSVPRAQASPRSFGSPSSPPAATQPARPMQERPVAGSANDRPLRIDTPPSGRVMPASPEGNTPTPERLDRPAVMPQPVMERPKSAPVRPAQPTQPVERSAPVTERPAPEVERPAPVTERRAPASEKPSVPRRPPERNPPTSVR